MDIWDIFGKTVVVTGGTTGIGRATVEELARRGAHVIFTARKPGEGDAVVSEVTKAVPNAQISHRELHLDDLASVRSFAAGLRADLNQLDVLVNNAGVSVAERRETTDGFELMFGVNHLGHFLLVEELRALLDQAQSARIVLVASDAHKMGGPLDFNDLQGENVRFGPVGGMRVYGRSKLANMLHGRQLATTFDSAQVTVNSLHPGFVRTRLARDSEASKMGEKLWPLISRFAKSRQDGAKTSVYAACSSELSGQTGLYLVNEKVGKTNKLAQDTAVAKRLWDVSGDLVGL